MIFRMMILAVLGIQMMSCGPKGFHDEIELTQSQSEPESGTESQITNGTGSLPGSVIAENTVAIISNFDPIRSTFFGYCSGIRLSSKIILTAAHCISNIEKMRVVTGVNINYGLRNPENFFEIEKAIIHEQYRIYTKAKDRRYFDIALVKLKESLPISNKNDSQMKQFEDPVSTSQYLYTHDIDDSSGHLKLNPVISGFGISFQKNQLASDPKKFIGTLNEASVKLSAFDYSQRVIKLSSQNSSQLCDGDSGGALYIWRNNRFYIQAIAISIKEEMNLDPFSKTICEKESSFLNLDFFKTWIATMSQQI